MLDTYTRLILIITLAILFSTWAFSSHFSTKIWLKHLFTIQGIFIAALETLILFQVLEIISFSLPVTAFDNFIVVIGIAINSLGTVFAIWAKLTMRENWGKPAQHDIGKQKYLVTHGIFSMSRNPIYIGLFCVFLGFELALKSAFVILAIPLLIGIYKVIIIEEKLLYKHFGKQYLAYKKKAPRFLKLNWF